MKNIETKLSILVPLSWLLYGVLSYYTDFGDFGGWIILSMVFFIAPFSIIVSFSLIGISFWRTNVTKLTYISILLNIIYLLFCLYYFIIEPVNLKM